MLKLQSGDDLLKCTKPQQAKEDIGDKGCKSESFIPRNSDAKLVIRAQGNPWRSPGPVNSRPTEESDRARAVTSPEVDILIRKIPLNSSNIALSTQKILSENMQNFDADSGLITLHTIEAYCRPLN